VIASVPAAPPARGPGRPRDARADEAILEAALELLAEVGPTGLSVEEVAARAGVSKATLYRRWPTKHDLVVAALAVLARILPDESPDGPVRDAVVHVVRSWWRSHSETPGGVVFQRVLAHAKSNPTMFGDFYDNVVQPRREVFRRVIQRGIEAGELRPDTDVELLVTSIIGTSVYLQQVRSSGRDPAPGTGPEELVDALLAAWRC
jgi:AcrR family transcriptional regulator